MIFTIFTTYLYAKLYKNIEKKQFKSNTKLNVFTGIFLAYLIPFITSSTLNLQGGDLNYIVTLPENNFLKKATPGAIHDLDRVNRAYNKIKGESFEKYAGGGESIANVLKKYFKKKKLVLIIISRQTTFFLLLWNHFLNTTYHTNLKNQA